MVILNSTGVSGSACNNIIKVRFLPAKISRKCEKLKFCLLVVFALNFQLIDLVIRFVETISTYQLSVVSCTWQYMT